MKTPRYVLLSHTVNQRGCGGVQVGVSDVIMQSSIVTASGSEIGPLVTAQSLKYGEPEPMRY
jgi:hypothetical protein